MHFVLAHNCGQGSLLQSGVHEIVAVETFAFHREEEFSWSDRSGVDGIGLGNLFTDSRGGYLDRTRSRNKLRDLPERQFHAGIPAVATGGSHSNPAALRAWRATSTSSNG